jgi:hypothetical protein
MKKIPTLFLRDENDRAHVTSTPNPECAWVFEGEGVATRKYDGTCVFFDGREWWARREVKPGKTPPPMFAEVDYDEVTGKAVGWEPIAQSSFAKFHDEALIEALPDPFEVGTYELCGPRVNGNPERLLAHRLFRHGEVFVTVQTDYDWLASALPELRRINAVEGIVWHHPDGRMAKLKGRDF